MPTQITHAVLGERFYSKYFQQFSKQQFLIGNSFPDIRRVAKVDRTLTHPIVSALAECQSAPDGFAAGMCFHAFVDMVRQRAMRTYRVYESHESSPQYITATKLLEDELLYAHIHDWNEIIRHLDQILPKERVFGIPEQSLRRWHTMLQNYFLKPPGPKERLAFAKDQIPLREALAINEEVERLRQAPDFRKKIAEVFLNFERLLLEGTNDSP